MLFQEWESITAPKPFLRVTPWNCLQPYSYQLVQDKL